MTAPQNFRCWVMGFRDFGHSILAMMPGTFGFWTQDTSPNAKRPTTNNFRILPEIRQPAAIEHHS